MLNVSVAGKFSPQPSSGNEWLNDALIIQSFSPVEKAAARDVDCFSKPDVDSVAPFMVAFSSCRSA